MVPNAPEHINPEHKQHNTKAKWRMILRVPLDGVNKVEMAKVNLIGTIISIGVFAVVIFPLVRAVFSSSR